MRRTDPRDFAHDVLGFILDSLVEAQEAPNREIANACLAEAAGAIPCLMDAVEDEPRLKARILLAFDGEADIRAVAALNEEEFPERLARLRLQIGAAFRAAGGSPDGRHPPGEERGSTVSLEGKS